jgi:Ni2+-binding GTPase involved in maturation of urease and hydrogenase
MSLIFFLVADFIIYVIDVAGGDKVPRKGGKV